MKKYLQVKRIENRLAERVYCSEEENEKILMIYNKEGNLPEGVFKAEAEYELKNGVYSRKPTRFFRSKTLLNGEEINECLSYKKIELLDKINNKLTFFTALTIISLVVSLIITLSLL